ncbi:MAG: COG4280 domain-containing protein [Gemmatimonadales bacterium]
MHLAHVGTVVLAAFLASLVEFVEALTIVLAVGTVRGWRPALIGAAAGTAFLALLVLAFGPALGRVPIATLQLVVGILLLLFGMRWLRKAILRSAGVIGLHDEAAIFDEESAALRAGVGQAAGRPGLDGVALATAFKAVTLEGLEVIFIVIAAGAGGMLLPATVGAVVAGALVILAGLALHRPLARVPENTLKFGVGLLLSAFGVFWIGEGLGFPWPGEDLSLFGLLAGFLAVSVLAVVVAKGQAAPVARRAGGVTP